MNWKHLLYAIPLCLVLGFIFGFYWNIPKHITIDTGDNLRQLSEDMKDIIHTLPNTTQNYYNLTTYNYQYNGYEEYATLLGKINHFSNDIEKADLIYSICKDKQFCDCEDIQKINPIISNALHKNITKKLFILFDEKEQQFKETKDFDYFGGNRLSFNELETRAMISYMGVGETLTFVRFE